MDEKRDKVKVPPILKILINSFTLPVHLRPTNGNTLNVKVNWGNYIPNHGPKRKVDPFKHRSRMGGQRKLLRVKTTNQENT